MANQKTIAEQFYATRDTEFDEAFWNRFLLEITAKFKNLEAIEISWESLSEDALAVALDRINSVLGPATERIQNIVSLGFLSVESKSLRTLSIGTVSFTAEAGDQLELFVPTPFVAVTRASNPFDFAIGRVVYFNRDDRIIDIDIVYFEGNPGPHDDWTISAVAGQALAQANILTATYSARDAAVSAKVDAEGAKDAAEDARDITVEVAGTYHGARTTPPAGADIGHQYLDTSVTPNVVKVLTESGWAPTVTVSIGGVREVDFPIATGTEGTGPFAVGGGFTRGDIYLNGVKLRNGVDVTLSPGASGTFTLADALAAGDEMSFRGYFANDVVDIYTKSETYNKSEVYNKAEVNTRTYTKAEVDTIVAAALPIGTIIDVYGDGSATIPGFLKVVPGLEVTAAYPELRAFGLANGWATNGAGNPVMPNVDSLFKRGWRSGQTRDAGRAFGSVQEDALQNITGSIGGRNEYYAGNGVGALYPGPEIQGALSDSNGPTRSINFDASRVARTAAETRPANLTVTWYIKAYGAAAPLGTLDPAKLADDMASLASRATLLEKKYESAPLTASLGTLFTQPHGLGVKPTNYRAYIVCVTSEHNWQPGDEIEVRVDTNGTTSGYGIAVWADATNIYGRVGNASMAVIFNKVTGAPTSIITANWRVVLRARP